MAVQLTPLLQLLKQVEDVGTAILYLLPLCNASGLSTRHGVDMVHMAVYQ